MLEKQIRKAILEAKDNKEKLLIEQNFTQSKLSLQLITSTKKSQAHAAA